MAIIASEEALLAKVQARVSQKVAEPKARVGTADFDRELLSLRDAIAEAKPEDLAPLVEQMTRMAAIRSRLGGSIDLPVDVTSPYFGHMELREGEKVRDVLIGKRGFIDREAGVQIVDWRNAPISRVYYRYDEGDDYDEHVGGKSLEGVVTLRRNLSIQKAVLRRIGCPQGTFVQDTDKKWHIASSSSTPLLQGGSGTAARIPKAPIWHDKRANRSKKPARLPAKDPRQLTFPTLGVHHGEGAAPDKHLPEIAALIDREQFDLVTQPDSGMIVIQGGAGSGKTTVALHRVAYLAFADKNRFRPNQMLFVVPTTSLERYVSGVLPSLGVRGVPVVTYANWARNTRRRLLRDSAPNLYTDDISDDVARVKKHPLLLKIIDQFVLDETKSLEAEFESFDPALASAFRDLKKPGLCQRLRHLRRMVKQKELRLTAAFEAEQLLSRAIEDSDDIYGNWGDLLTDTDRLAPLRDAGISAQAIKETVDRCLAQQEDPPPVEEVEAIDGRDLDENSIASKLDPEDDPILIRLVYLKRGILAGASGGPISYQHIAIDEAQDRSAIEVRVLLDAIEKDPSNGQKSVTIAGDTAQRLVFDNDFSGWENLLRSMGEDAAVVSPLKLSYRSTAEIMQLSRDVLGDDLAPESPLAARSGAPIELHAFGDVGEAVGFLGDALRKLLLHEPNASVAVVSRYTEQADTYYGGLLRSEVPHLRRIRNHEFSFVPGIDVTDVSQVKGLEFDYVIMVDVNESSYPIGIESRHLLHIGMTRAAHQLWLVSTSEICPLLPESLKKFA